MDMYKIFDYSSEQAEHFGMYKDDSQEENYDAETL